MVTLIEGALEKVADRWDKQSAEITSNMKMMLELQRAHLELEQACLEFEHQKAGLAPKQTHSKKYGMSSF